MPTQDKDTEMAIPSQPRKLARKLMQIDLTPYAMGRAAKEVTKKFTAKHPVEVSDYPADDAESNNARFKGGKVNKDNTRKADYKTGGDENAYESVIKRKLIEKFSKMAVVSTKKPIVSTISDIGPGRKASNVKVVKSNEETIAEAGEPMSPAPATSDSPGWSGDSAMATDNGADNEKTNNSGDDNEENETVNGVREKLENIAMMSAEMFENLQDDAELDKHVIEKLELAHNFIEAVSKEINDSKSGDDEEEDEPEGNQGGKDDNNIAKPSAFKGNGEQSMAKEEVELDEATVPAPSEDDEGYYTHKEIHGKNAVSKEDWKNGIRKPKTPVKESMHSLKKKNKTTGVSPLEKSMMKGYNTESALGDAMGSEEGVKKIAPKKDQYGNEIKNPARSLARKAMKTFATKKGA
jgi:hypothetical protein